jgi:hypothetical protein
MTYQLVLCGKDGVVLASDRRELRESGGIEQYGHGFSANMLCKIRIDKTGQYAWMFSGGELGPFAAKYITPPTQLLIQGVRISQKLQCQLHSSTVS